MPQREAVPTFSSSAHRVFQVLEVLSDPMIVAGLLAPGCIVGLKAPSCVVLNTLRAVIADREFYWFVPLFAA